MADSFSQIKEKKNKCRTQCKQIRAEIDSNRREEYSRIICNTFIGSTSFSYYDTLLCYSPIGTEVDVMPIAQKALQMKKAVAFPKITGKGKMEFRYAKSLDCLEKGTFGIYEPNDGCEIYVPDSKQCACVILPALAFDRYGHRLGYGGGYYDRFLSTYNGSTVGVLFSRCLFDVLPHGKHDMCADVLITEGGVLTVEKKH